MASISHERIYQFIREDKASGGDLFKNLRQGKNKYRKSYDSKKKSKIALGKVSIGLRPDLINNKERLGDWEIDTIVGKDRRSAIITVTERISKRLVAKYIPSHTSIVTARATVAALNPYLNSNIKCQITHCRNAKILNNLSFPVLTPDGEEDKYIATSYGDNEKHQQKEKWITLLVKNDGGPTRI